MTTKPKAKKKSVKKTTKNIKKGVVDVKAPSAKKIIKVEGKLKKSPKHKMELNNIDDNNRLTMKQYKALMKKASEELGINDKKGLPILDLARPNNREPTPKESLELVLECISFYDPSAIETYKETIKSKRLTYKDKMSVLSWICGKGKKPFKLIDAKEKDKSIRNEHVGVKKWGDVKTHPIRVILDDEYLKEIRAIHGERRKKFDAFDKLDVDQKIMWARYVKGILGTPEKFQVTTALFTGTKEDIAVFAMNYACKMCNLKEFKGIFARPYWIIYRALGFCDLHTTIEADTFVEMALSFFGDSTQYSKILSYKELIARIEPVVLEIGKWSEYQSALNSDSLKHVVKSEQSKFRLMSQIIRDHYAKENLSSRK